MEHIMYARLGWKLEAVSNSAKSLNNLITAKVARPKLGGGSGCDAHSRLLV